MEPSKFGTISDSAAYITGGSAADDENHAAFEYMFSAGGTHFLVVDGSSNECDDFTRSGERRGPVTGVGVEHIRSTFDVKMHGADSVARHH